MLWRVVVVACSIVTSPAVAVTPSGGGSPDQGPVPWTCVAHVQPLQASGSAMHANGFQACSGAPTWKLQRVVVAIQQHRFLGFWKTVETTDSGLSSDASLERTVFYDCKAQGGTATFRAQIIGYAANNQHRSNEPLSTNEIDMDCVKGVGVSHQVG